MIGIDLFAGAGGMSLGARRSGVDVQIVVESDKWAATTYEANHMPKFGVFANDIREFEPVELGARRKPLVVFGGPPCQGFSTSNQKTRTAQNENNWLFEEFLRVVKHYMPDWVVFENVRGILETEGGLFVEKIANDLMSMGYEVNYDVLCATDFGVPQKRSRFFLIASLHGRSFVFPKPDKKRPKVTVKQAISDLPDVENGANTCELPYKYKARATYASSLRNGESFAKNNLVTNNGSLIVDRYRHIPQGGNWENIPDRLMGNYKNKSRCHTGIYRRLEEDKPSVVIGNFRKNMLVHPTKHRGLSVREAARLQSFPDDFVFTGSIGFQQQQVGNAVPPLLAEAIFRELMKQSS